MNRSILSNAFAALLPRTMPDALIHAGAAAVGLKFVLPFLVTGFHFTGDIWTTIFSGAGLVLISYVVVYLVALFAAMTVFPAAILAAFPIPVLVLGAFVLLPALNLFFLTDVAPAYVKIDSDEYGFAAGLVLAVLIAVCANLVAMVRAQVDTRARPNAVADTSAKKSKRGK